MASKLESLYKQFFGVPAGKIEPLQAHASERRIFRLWGLDSGSSVIGIENPNIKENKAFIYFSNYFRECGLPVPKIFCQSEDNLFYLEEDLGDTTLFDFVQTYRNDPNSNELSDSFPAALEELYKKVISFLPLFQIKHAAKIDYTNCAQDNEFQPKSMRRDMDYFEESFLKKINFTYSSQKLNQDFEKLTQYLSQFKRDFFMYRDFQSRNVMIIGNDPWFIDYQGGRKGPLQYDLASLLFQASAQIPTEVRTRLIDQYIEVASTLTDIDKKIFIEGLWGFVVVRMLQVLGTYGKQGLEQQKPYFLDSIPRAVKNLSEQAKTLTLMDDLPELKRISLNLLQFYKIDS